MEDSLWVPHHASSHQCEVVRMRMAGKGFLHVVQVGLKLIILLLQPAKSWDL